MNRMYLATVAATALAVSGCSMFSRSEPASQASARPQAPQSAYSGSSQPTPRSAQTTTSQGSAAMGTSVSSDDLRQAQQKLKDEGDYSGQIDGKFGPKTAEALKKFQERSGLQQSGKLDQQTASRLGVGTSSGYGSSTPPSGSSAPNQQ